MWGNSLAEGLIALLIFAFVVGVVVALGGYFGIGWLTSHLTIGWH